MVHLFKDIEDNEDNESHTGKMAHLLTMTTQKITMSVHTGKRLTCSIWGYNKRTMSVHTGKIAHLLNMGTQKWMFLQKNWLTCLLWGHRIGQWESYRGRWLHRICSLWSPTRPPAGNTSFYYFVKPKLLSISFKSEYLLERISINRKNKFATQNFLLFF